MNKEIKDRWIKALRSGEYEQGRHRLRPDYKFCCLGVLCDVIDDSKWVEFEDGNIAYNMNLDVLPKALRNDIGLDFEAMKRLAHLNDEEEASFGEIADWIEENL